MKKLSKGLIIALSLLTVASCARNDIKYYSVSESLNTAEAKKVIDPNIALYFGQDVPGQLLLKDAKTNRKTNAYGKEDFKTCNWAFLSAVVSLQKRAKSLGATKVTNILSNYKGSTFKTPGQYECHVGNVVSRVSLIGDIKK
ncbi:excinuclease ABC subunit A [Psittacicella gerlachiana]|uniref:Excinuclease ABC subunit A n=1 Tax=Psittacicella gerlachiana TaxID=2028574 RepID=A0A3A1YHZ4_9GAMM|nr:excinuclease ABC subunit A [Psittacicella gerlachiana]RIY36828.1 excinuclease ABC subunit A [Psittacicella gerlachiana]